MRVKETTHALIDPGCGCDDPFGAAWHSPDVAISSTVSTPTKQTVASGQTTVPETPIILKPEADSQS